MSDKDDISVGSHRSHPSYFPGIQFLPNETYLRRGKADPMSKGMDPVEIAKLEDRLHDMMEEGEIPHSYSIHNPIQLLPERVIDTTNKETLLMAKSHGFDPDGFKHGKPLQKSLFYMSPYMTCRWCNLVNHVDISIVRRTIHLKKRGMSASNNEKLPPCKQCERADYFEVGIFDFSKEIAIREEEAKIKKERELAAVIILQRSYRHYLRRMFGAAFSKKMAAERLLYYKAATAINAVARGRLARRRIVCERHLKIIKEAHPILLKHALKNKADGKKKLKVFWYRRKEQVDLLFRNYVALLDRMGHDPPRSVLERNIAEISRRIVARKAELIIMIQKVWRGFLGRRVVKLYRLEIIRLKQWFIANILKVQRMYRGHASRVGIFKYFKAKTRNKTMKNYREARKKGKIEKKKKLNRNDLQSSYQHLRSEAYTARATQRIDPPRDHGNVSIRAFEKSLYATDDLNDRIKTLMEVDSKIHQYEKDEVHRQRSRRSKINNLIAEHGPVGFGSRGFKNQELLEKLHELDHDTTQGHLREGRHAGLAAIWGYNESSTNSLVESSRSRGMRAYHADELEEIMDKTVERVQHDFTNKHIPKAIKNFNILSKNPGGSLMHYKYPKDINENPMDWLNDDIDSTIKQMDIKAQAK